MNIFYIFAVVVEKLNYMTPWEVGLALSAAFILWLFLVFIIEWIRSILGIIFK